jgi:hypothetical protein
MDVTEEMRQLLRRSIKCLPYDSSPKKELNDLLVMMNPPPQHEVHSWFTSGDTPKLFSVCCTCGQLFTSQYTQTAMEIFWSHVDANTDD